MRAISSMATRGVLTELAAAGVAAGLPAWELESVGGVDAAARVRAGEPWDLVFLAEGSLARLAAEGHVDAATLTPLFVSSVAAAVAAPGVEVAVDSGGVAFADAAAMRAVVEGAGRIGYSTGPSGTALLSLIDAWGLTDAVAAKLVQAPPGVPVALLVARGEVELGFQQLSELVGAPGIRILGTLPSECAITTVFAGAVAATAVDPDAARGVLAFLASDDAAEIVARHSFAAV